jgi:HEAT repeat protein
MEADIALWRIQRNVSEALPKITNDLSQVDEHSKWEIFEALAEMGSAAKVAVLAIAPDLKSHNSELRQRAAEALWKIDPAQAPAVVEALIEPMNNPSATTANPYSVTQGAELLGEMGSAAESAAPSLNKLLKHSYLPARTAAAEALRRISVGQRDGAANGSQPTRSETNRTSAAAGSRR